MSFPRASAEAHDIPLKDELKRKALHLIALVVPLGMHVAGRPLALGVLIPITVVAVAADVLRARSATFARFIQRIFGQLMRPDEWSPHRAVRVNGATWVLVAATVLAIIFPLAYAIPAFVMFMVADATAAVIGRRFGRHAWPGTSRTLEGSAAFAAVASTILLFFPSIGLLAGAAMVFVATIAEALPLPFNDNIRVPVLAAAVLWIMGV